MLKDNIILKKQRKGIERRVPLILIMLLLIIGISILSIQSTAAQTERAVKAQSSQKKSTLKRDVYSIGSISKMYTTAAVMKLAEEGKIDLDEPLVTYLPEFSMADERYTQITPRMLLNHTSGLMGTTTHDSFTFGRSDTRYHDMFLEELRTQSLKAEPGEYGVYCNDGFTLAELLVEKISGMGFSEYLDETFFEPLELRDTFTAVHDFDEERIATSYLGDSKLPYVDCHLIGSGGIYSTASDVARFGQLLAGIDPKILSEQTLQQMAESYTDKDSICRVEGDKQMNYGLGWDCVDTYPYNAYGVKALTKGGSIIFQNSALVVLPEENISASMIVSGGSGDDATYALQDLILEILQEEGIIDEVKDLKVQANQVQDMCPLPDELRDYAGLYLSNELIRVSFSEDGMLLLENAEDQYSMVQEYAYVGEGRFAPQNGAYLNHIGELTYNSNGNSGYGTIGFRKELNGKTYLYGNAHETIYGLGENAMSLVFAEKIESPKLNEADLAAWNERDGKLYFLTDSVYNSWNYYTEGVVELQCNREQNGYIHTDKMTDVALIQDAAHAKSTVDLPIMIGRDLAVYEMEQTGEGERLNLSTLTYQTEDQVNSIGALPQKLTMTKSEETAWFRIDADHANQELQVIAPRQGAYYLYDQDRYCIASSVMLTNNEAILLPEGGYLVLVGEPDQQFEIRAEWMNDSMDTSK